MENENIVVKQKSNKVIIVILIVIILGLCSYITYDKFISIPKEECNETKKEVSKTEEELIESYFSTNSDANAFLQVLFDDVSEIDMEYVLAQKYLYGQSVVENCSTETVDCTVPTFNKTEIDSLFETYTGKNVRILKNEIPSFNDYKYKTTKFDGGYINFYAEISKPKIKDITINDKGNYVMKYSGVAYGHDFSKKFEKELEFKLTDGKLILVSNTKAN